MDVPKWEDLKNCNYQRGGRDPATGLDCFGLVLEIYRRADIVLWPPDFKPLAGGWIWVQVREPLRALDVAFFSGDAGCAVALDENWLLEMHITGLKRRSWRNMRYYADRTSRLVKCIV